MVPSFGITNILTETKLLASYILGHSIYSVSCLLPSPRYSYSPCSIVQPSQCGPSSSIFPFPVPGTGQILEIVWHVGQNQEVIFLLYTSDEKTRGKVLIDLKQLYFPLIELSKQCGAEQSIQQSEKRENHEAVRYLTQTPGLHVLWYLPGVSNTLLILSHTDFILKGNLFTS